MTQWTFGGTASDVCTDSSGNVVPDWPVQVVVAGTGAVVSALYEADGTTPISQLRSNTVFPPGAIRTFKADDVREIKIRYQDAELNIVEWYQAARELAPNAYDAAAQADTSASDAELAAAAAQATATSAQITANDAAADVAVMFDDPTQRVKTTALPDLEAAPYVRHRVRRWDLMREASVRGISTANIATIVNTVRADGAFQDNDVLFLRPGSYASSSEITLSRPCYFQAEGATITSPGGIKQINISSSDVHVEGVKLVGPGSSYVAGSYAIYSQAASYAAALQRVSIANVEIANCAYIAIWARYHNDLRIDSCNIHDVVYAGIHLQSAIRFWCTRNRVDNVTRTGLGANAYGIIASGVETDNLTTDPHSAQGVIADNTVAGVPLWEGIDTHGGRYITITGNRVSNCLHGINAVHREDQTGTAWSNGSPIMVVIANNVIDSTVTDGSRGAAIRFSGGYNSGVTQYATGTISGNTIRNHGNDVAAGSGSTGWFGAMYVGMTRGLAITGNSIENPTIAGIRLNLDNDGYVISGNTFLEVWSATADYSACIIPTGNNNVGGIAGNTHVATGSHSGALRRNEAFFRSASNSYTGQSTVIGDNQHQCTLNVVNMLSTLKWSAFQTNPVARGTLTGGSTAAQIVTELQRLGIVG